jgi:hypothetical protein
VIAWASQQDGDDQPPSEVGSSTEDRV